MTTEQRVEKLERQNRWMRRIGAVGVALIAACVLGGQGEAKDKKPQDLVVRSLQVVDEDGKVRAELGHTLASGTSGLRLKDRNGTLRASLSTANADGIPRLIVLDKNGTPRAVLGPVTHTANLTSTPQTTPEGALTVFRPDGTVLWLVANQ
ncbi:MAG: hypothetical protein ACYS0K_21685 [Planctomycetota bacterium]|jgi:hypothetical protein